MMVQELLKAWRKNSTQLVYTIQIEDCDTMQSCKHNKNNIIIQVSYTYYAKIQIIIANNN